MRTNFTDEQRAELFRLDRATCTFSGRNLWMLDWGLDPWYAIDWAEHVIPASKGGRSEILNGATASYLHNYIRGNTKSVLYLFYRGRPTADCIRHWGTISDAIWSQLERFAKLQMSDWFLNRALWHLSLACSAECDAKQGKKLSRRKEYYTAAATKALAKWRRHRDLEGSESIEVRGLAPAAPEFDQEILLNVRSITEQSDLLKIVWELLDAYTHTKELLDLLYYVNAVSDLEAVRLFAAKHNDIPLRLKARTLETISQLELILPANFGKQLPGS